MQSSQPAVLPTGHSVPERPSLRLSTPHGRATAVLDCITRHVAEGAPPSLREIEAETGIRSRLVIAETLDALEERELIRRIPGRHRNIRLTEKARAAMAASA